MKNILRSRPRTVANRPTSGGWGNKKCFFRPTAAGQGLISRDNWSLQKLKVKEELRSRTAKVSRINKRFYFYLGSCSGDDVT